MSLARDLTRPRRPNRATGVQVGLAILDKALDAVDEVCSPHDAAAVHDIHRRRLERRIAQTSGRRAA